MVNYACAFSQSELGKYFEWIIKLFNKWSKIYKKMNTSEKFESKFFNLLYSSNSNIFLLFHSNNSSGIFSGRLWKRIGDHLGSYLGWFWVSFWVGHHFGSCTNLKARPGASGELDVEFKFQRRCCKLSFLLPPCSQSSPESLLASYLELSLFQAPKCVSFSFASFPLSESLEQATLNLRKWFVEGKILPVTVLNPFVVVSPYCFATTVKQFSAKKERG